MEDLFRTFSKVFKGLPDPGRSAEILVFGAWSKCLSGQLVRNAVPLRLEKKKLIAGVPNELWRRNVADLGPEIVERINLALGSNFIDFVEFRVVPGHNFERDGDGILNGISEIDWSSAAEERLTPDIRVAAGAIADAGLRRKFLAAAGSNLARQSFISERAINEE